MLNFFYILYFEFINKYYVFIVKIKLLNEKYFLPLIKEMGPKNKTKYNNLIRVGPRIKTLNSERFR